MCDKLLFTKEQEKFTLGSGPLSDMLGENGILHKALDSTWIEHPFFSPSEYTKTDHYLVKFSERGGTMDLFFKIVGPEKIYSINGRFFKVLPVIYEGNIDEKKLFLFYSHPPKKTSRFPGMPPSFGQTTIQRRRFRRSISNNLKKNKKKI